MSSQLPLEPSQTSHPTVWVEKTIVQSRRDRLEGPHRLGEALWSPQRSADGRDIYANMRAVQLGDLVLHLIDNDAIAGTSVVAAPLDQSFNGVPGTDWADRRCYRIALKEFQPLDPPLRREWFFSDPEVAARLRELSIVPRGRGLFFNSKLELNQGSYLTEAPTALVAALDLAYLRRTGTHISGLPIAMHAAEDEEEDNEGARALEGQPPQARRSCVYAPGPKAVYWDEFYQEGIMALGWDNIGDFRQYANLQDMRQALERVYGNEKDQGQNARMCYDFANSVQSGDAIFVKRGLHVIVGRGIVDGDYQHDPRRPKYKNCRRVRWTARGEWPWSGQLPLKTSNGVDQLSRGSGEGRRTYRRTLFSGYGDPAATYAGHCTRDLYH